MKQQSASQFQRVNSRRLWTGIGFLVILLLLVLMLCSYMLVILARGGGSDLITHYQLVGECASSRMMPLAAAVDRYYRDKGHYPERIEEVYPDYLKDQNSLRCPADPGKQAAAGSFEYHPPERGGKSEPAIFCNHHGSVVLRVQAHATPADDGHTDWELRIQPRSGQQPP